MKINCSIFLIINLILTTASLALEPERRYTGIDASTKKACSLEIAKDHFLKQINNGSFLIHVDGQFFVVDPNSKNGFFKNSTDKITVFNFIEDQGVAIQQLTISLNTHSYTIQFQDKFFTDKDSASSNFKQGNYYTKTCLNLNF